MKVISIGRSNDNDVRIDDLYVGRHHCQIVQHDNGTHTVVDMNSRNGTFVNGRRIFGEVQLQPYDSVTIGHTNLPWRSYFTRKTKPYTLPIVLGSVGGVLLTMVLTLLIFRHGSDKTFAFKGEYPDAVVVSMVDEDGTPYTIEAIEGQVCVWFEEGVPYKTAKQSIEASGGRIVAQIPENGYYLVEVPANKVQVFLRKIVKETTINWACPNMVSYSCTTSNYILDNFNTMDGYKSISHGEIVQYALQEFDPVSPLRGINIGTKNGMSVCKDEEDMEDLSNMCINSEVFALDDISRLPSSGPIIINMSYGPGLHEREKVRNKDYKWKDATDAEKFYYRASYLTSIKSTIQNLKPLEGMDYIVVHSAGNEGVKTFDADIISMLRKTLTPYEKEIMDKHFLLVAAGETEKKHQDYSNEMESGHNDPWVTKMDISDFKYNNRRWYGTSFAAPRAAGILSSVANEMNLTGAEVLKYAREATLLHPEHLLTMEGLTEQVSNSKPIQIVGGGASMSPSPSMLSREQIKQDLVGVVIRDPAPNSYFPKDWTWTLKRNEIADVTIKNEAKPSGNQNNATITIHLKRHQLSVDVDAIIRYRQVGGGWKYDGLTVQRITFPPQQDYSSNVNIYMAYDFMPSLMVKNTSGMALFVAGSYTTKGETNRFCAELEPYEEKMLGFGPSPDSYSIHFAYKE